MGAPESPKKSAAIDSFNMATIGKVTGLFDFADLDAPYKYLRGCRGLKIPPEWEGAIPKFESSGVAT